MDLNKAMLLGRMTQDPQSRSTANGQNVASFGVATNRRWKDRNTGEMKEEVQFHNIVAWGKLGDICSQYMHKGMKVLVEGRIQNRSWDDQQTGQKKYRTEIVADNIIMLDSKSGGSQQAEQNSFNNNQSQSQNKNQSQNNFSQQKPQNQNEMNIPSAEEIPTINIDDEKEEIKLEDIPF
ncbi:MAG: single-stranded DNA-binding protein [Patescibacteria group bacterium]|jgi:single-strand DNA-binding protein|nr:single-stranded DNA-binding protein [Patescibacteria group bacterium]